jgi:hypothetical protein
MNDLIAALDSTAIAAHRVAEQHDHGCPIGSVAREVRNGCHEVIETLQEFAGGKGPPQVSNNAYRRGWETIFGKAKEVGQA